MPEWVPDMGNDDLVGVSVDDEVGVVGDHDYLSLTFGRLEQRDEFVVDRLRVEVLLRLVDDQRSVISVIERQVKQD